MTKISDCCGTPAKNEHDQDFGFCSRCREYCNYITEYERNEEIEKGNPLNENEE